MEGVKFPANPLEGPAGNSEEWLEWRKGHIGASEVGAAMGFSKWSQPLDIYNLKLGLTKTDQTFPMWFGHQVEPIIAQAYSNRTQQPLTYPIPGYRHPVAQHIGATPDACWEDEPSVLIDMKATGSRTPLGTEGSDEIPEDWIAQAQAQMFVTGAQRVDFAVVQSNQLGIYTVERNLEFIEAMVEILTDLWDAIESRHPPEPDFEHPSVGKAIAAMADTSSEFVVPLSGYELELANRYTELGPEVKALQDERDNVKHRLMASLQGHCRGRLPDGREVSLKQVTVGPQMREGYSFKRMWIKKQGRKEKNVVKH